MRRQAAAVVTRPDTRAQERNLVVTDLLAKTECAPVRASNQAECASAMLIAAVVTVNTERVSEPRESASAMILRIDDGVLLLRSMP